MLTLLQICQVRTESTTRKSKGEKKTWNRSLDSREALAELWMTRIRSLARQPSLQQVRELNFDLNSSTGWPGDSSVENLGREPLNQFAVRLKSIGKILGYVLLLPNNTRKMTS